LLASFFFTAPASPQIYTLSLHDALPISYAIVESVEYDRTRGVPRVHGLAAHATLRVSAPASDRPNRGFLRRLPGRRAGLCGRRRSEEHTSELQSPYDLVCRLLLEKKKKQ